MMASIFAVAYGTFYTKLKRRSELVKKISAHKKKSAMQLIITIFYIAEEYDLDDQKMNSRALSIRICREEKKNFFKVYK